MGGLLQLTPNAFGLWTGASIHEIAQVVAAAFQSGADSGNLITKLSRLMLLAPMILALGYFSAKRRHTIDNDHVKRPTTQGVPMPWFVLGFIAMMLFNSFDLIPGRQNLPRPGGDHFPSDGRPCGDGARDGFRQIADEGLEASGRRPRILGVHFGVQPRTDRTGLQLSKPKPPQQPDQKVDGR